MSRSSLLWPSLSDRSATGRAATVMNDEAENTAWTPVQAETFLKAFKVEGLGWVVVKIMVPFGVPIIIRHLLFRVPKKGP